MNEIDVAIVIVTYRSAAVAVDCLASIRAERESHDLRLRVVVIDNASGDFPQIAQAIEANDWSAWVTLILAPKNGGFSYGNNLGIRATYERGHPDYLYLLNPDTQVRPGAIAELVKFMESHPQVGIAGSSFETERGEEWPFAFRFPNWVSEIEHGLQLGPLTRLLSDWTVARPMTPVAQPTDWICGASMMIRPSVFAAVGALDENFFLYFEETEFCHRARSAGFSTWYVPASRVMHMIGKSTNLTEATRESRRLPGYWFESRTRYFASVYGVPAATAIDFLAIMFGMVGLLRKKILRRASTPHYIRDLVAHSVWLPRNRRLAPLKTFFPDREYAPANGV